MRRTRLLIAAAIVAAALVYVIIGGIRGAVVYYITPSELLAQPAAPDTAIRLGGQVVPGSKVWNPATQELRFRLTDGSATVAVEYRGAPPGLFTEGQGAIVEGIWDPAGVVRARSIIVKHSEEYAPPSPRP